jgi:hypothetical protein
LLHKSSRARPIHIGEEGEVKTMRENEQIAAWVRRRVQGVRALSSILCVPAIAIAITLAASTPASAQSFERTPMVGGPGGTLSEHICGPGRVLVGVQGYAGVLLDNVQAICARVDANGLSDAKPEGPVFGGARPINGNAKCPGDSLVVTAFIQENEKDPYVGLISLTCRGEPQEVSLRGTGHLKGYTSPLLTSPSSEYKIDGDYIGCSGQNVAVGIRVRAGKFLDAFGLICGPPTKILPKRRKPKGTFEEGRDRTTTSLPNVVKTPASAPTPAPSPAPETSSTAPSTNINLPTPLRSNELKGDVKEGTPPQFYSFPAGPGEVVFTLDVSGAEPGGGAAYIYLIKPDALDDFLEGFDLFAPAGSSENLVKRVQFAERQTIILRVGGHIGGGSYRLRISGAATFN